MHEFKNSLLIDEGIFCICDSEDYASTTVISFSITNTHTASMKISVHLFEGYTGIYIVKDLDIAADETITIIGDSQKISLKPLNYLKLTSDYTGSNYLSTTVSVLNMFVDWYVIPPNISWGGIVGLFGGADVNLDIIDQVIIPAKANSTDFGDLTVGRHELTACSDSTIGLFAGGYSLYKDEIDYITFAIASDATDFSNLTIARRIPAACSDGTYGVFVGGNSGAYEYTMDYVTIAIQSDATDFGDLITARGGQSGTSNGTTGLFNAGYGAGYIYTIEKITISIMSDATDWGDALGAKWQVGCASNYNYAFTAGGSGGTQNIIDYKLFSTDANATDFADLTVGRYTLAGCSNNTRAVFGAGYSAYNILDYIEMDIKANAIDFGDLTTGRREIASCSGN